jgi:hypothetical protein
MQHLTNLFKVYMVPTHDWWEKAYSFYFGGGEILAWLLDDDDDDDTVLLQQSVQPVYVYFTSFKHLCSNYLPLAAVS